MKKAAKKSVSKKPTSPAKKSGKPVSLDSLPSADGGKYLVIHRRELKAAPYNPRFIDPVSAKRLRESLELSGGLLQPVVWNRLTGNIVGGHKRLEQEDIIQGTDDYKLTVCVVEMDDATEIETNIRLNSPLSSGHYDVEALDELMVMDDVRIENTGLDMSFLQELHDNAGMDYPEWMLAPEDREGVEALRDEGMEDTLAETLDEIDEAEAVEDADAEIDEIKRRKEHFKLQEGFAHQHDTSFRVVFPSNTTCSEFLKLLGKAFTGEYVDGMSLAELVDPKMKLQLQQMLKDEKPGKLKDFKGGDKRKKKAKK